MERDSEMFTCMCHTTGPPVLDGHVYKQGRHVDATPILAFQGWYVCHIIICTCVTSSYVYKQWRHVDATPTPAFQGSWLSL